MEDDTVAGESGTLEDLLVVEDNPGDRRLIEEAFEESSLGTTVHSVSTGEAALDFVGRDGEYENAPQPDMVLLDWSLPKMDGEEVLDALTTDFPEIPVVVMTGSDPLKETVESMTSQAEAYLTKPTEPDAYAEVLRSLTDVDTDTGT